MEQVHVCNCMYHVIGRTGSKFQYIGSMNWVENIHFLCRVTNCIQVNDLNIFIATGFLDLMGFQHPYLEKYGILTHWG